MTSPSHEATELDRLPPKYFGGGRILPALVPASCLDMGLLASFQDRMQAAAGQAVQVHRMRYDRQYAFDCIARAHGSDDALLRKLALMLFDTYQGGALR